MTDDARLIHHAAAAYQRVAEVQVRQRARVDQVVGDDGNVLPEALTRTTPLLSRTWWLPGAVTTGANKAEEHRLPQAATAVVLHARAKVAPSTAEFQADLYVSGVLIDNVSIPIGAFAGTSVMATALPAGGVLTVNVGSAGGAEDVTLSLDYRPTL